MNINDLRTLRDTAIFAARQAGTSIMQLYDITDFETKSDGSPVTVADCAAHDIIHAILKKTHITILSEESDGISLPYPEYLWIIDPIDGTKGFINSTGDFAIMIGLIKQGVPILGVVYAPTRDSLYYALRGEGAYVVHNGITKKLLLSEYTHTPLRFVCSSNHYNMHMEYVREKLGAVKVPMGGIGIKTTFITENKGDFFFTGASLGEWDVCAPHCILEEAGGTVTDCYGKPLIYGNPDHRIASGAIFSHPACHTDIQNAIHHAYEESTKQVFR